jgi:hypothetical protein
MKIASERYVTIQITDQSEQPILGMVRVIGVFSGKTRLSNSGITEAEFLCISRNCYEQRIWANQTQIETGDN